MQLAALFQKPGTTDTGWRTVDTSGYVYINEETPTWVESTGQRWVGKTYTETVYPVWMDFFEEFNQEHRDAFGIGIDRPWVSDDGAKGAKLDIDNRYIHAVSQYNEEFKKSIPVDTRYLGLLVQPNPYTPKPHQSTFWESALPVIGLGLAVVGFPQMMGELIVGSEIATASPIFTQAVGSMATSTIMNGGNVEKAVSNAALQMITSGAGDYVGTASDSVAMGKAAAAITASVITQQPIGVMPAVSVLINAAGEAGQTMGEDFTTDYTVDPSEWGPVDTSGDFLFPVTTEPVPVYTPDYTTDPTSWGPDYPAAPVEEIIVTESDVSSLATDAELQEIIDKNVNDSQAAKNEIMQLLKTRSEEKTGSSWLDTAKSAEALVKVAGSIYTTIKSAVSGRPVTTIPGQQPRIVPGPVGVPVRQANGTFVTNNGNGTQTIMQPDGSTQTVPITQSYGTAGAGQIVQGVDNLVLFGGVALAAVLLLRK